jgi:hypothetical protein
MAEAEDVVLWLRCAVGAGNCPGVGLFDVDLEVFGCPEGSLVHGKDGLPFGIDVGAHHEKFVCWSEGKCVVPVDDFDRTFC